MGSVSLASSVPMGLDFSAFCDASCIDVHLDCVCQPRSIPFRFYPVDERFLEEADESEGRLRFAFCSL